MSDDTAAPDERPGLLAAGSPGRFVLLTLVGYAVLGAVSGVVWEWVWTPPVNVIRDHQVFYSSYESLRRVFSGTGLYVVVGAAASALLSLAVCLLARARELVTLAAVLVGSVMAAAVMRQVGLLLGPADPKDVARTATHDQTVLGQLKVEGFSPYLVWPMVGLFVLALVFFAWPGGYDVAPRPRHADPAEADVRGARPR
jgi:hypothetical protein